MTSLAKAFEALALYRTKLSVQCDTVTIQVQKLLSEFNARFPFESNYEIYLIS